MPKGRERSMNRYTRIKTSMGHKYWMRMSGQEIIDRRIYRIALVVVPFISSALLFLTWVKAGG